MYTPIVRKGCYYNHVNASAENTLSQLQNPQVRDLAWACFSPVLLRCSQLPDRGELADCQFPLNTQRHQWLLQLDREPTPLLDHLARSKQTRLGLYFETLWQFFLQHDPEVELLAHNLPVRDGTRTLGEFDLLYFCRQRQRAVHLELALKFYLCATDCPGDAWHHWLGPNSQDRLDLKLDRLLHHQIRLGEKPQARLELAKLGAEDPLREIHIKGRLYRHFAHAVKPPPGYNEALPFDQWAHLKSTDEALADRISQPLDRSQWLAPLPRQSAQDTQPTPVVDCQDRPRQVATLNKHGDENARVFLVANHWPQLNAGETRA